MIENRQGDRNWQGDRGLRKITRATARVRPYNTRSGSTRGLVYGTGVPLRSPWFTQPFKSSCMVRDSLVENRPGNNTCIETVISCTLQYCSVSPWAKEAGAYPRRFGEGNTFGRRGAKGL